MADSTINGLSSGSTPLAGTEEVPIWQSSSTVKVTVQDIADLASGGTDTNIGTNDLTISSSGTRKLILGGALSTDIFAIRNSADTESFFEVKGSGQVEVNAPFVADHYSVALGDITFRARDGMSPNNIGIYGLVEDNTTGIYLSANSEQGHTPIHIFNRVLNSATGNLDSILIDSDNGNGLTEYRGINIDAINGGTTNIGVRLDVSNATNNYALDVVEGDFKFGTGNGSKIGTATSQKIGFWNATPVIQPTTGITAGAFTANTSGIVDDSATFDGYTIGQIAAALRQVGILAKKKDEN